ncbi:TPA: hypothetical protein DEG21_03985 [Patescibacteria group bacterium]|nr:hypothetical protein [Candidatus Gracilibacteria bacterium]HBY75008.1 hypothetical protein [Candidatus Gracilibacteria bacterium]
MSFLGGIGVKPVKIILSKPAPSQVLIIAQTLRHDLMLSKSRYFFAPRALVSLCIFYNLYFIDSKSFFMSSGISFGILASAITYISPVLVQIFLHFHFILNFVQGFVHSGIFSFKCSL